MGEKGEKCLSMVVMLEGDSEKSAHAWSKIGKPREFIMENHGDLKNIHLAIKTTRVYANALRIMHQSKRTNLLTLLDYSNVQS